ncbi:hypothetical protein ACN28S_38160 [Cystobacter fuscus]
MERLAGPLLAAGAAAKVALLPTGDDPDTFIRREGTAGLERLLGEARPLTAHVFSTVLPQGKEASFEEKMAALERLKPVSAQLPVGLVRSAFFAALSTWCGLPASELESALRSKAPPPPPPRRPGRVRPLLPAAPAPLPAGPRAGLPLRAPPPSAPLPSNPRTPWRRSTSPPSCASPGSSPATPSASMTSCPTPGCGWSSPTLPLATGPRTPCSRPPIS